MKKRKLLISLSIAILFTLILTTANLFAQPKRGAAIPIYRLPEKLKGIDIKDYFIPSEFKKVGIIHALNGSVIVIHKATGEAYFGMESDYIYENDSLESLANSRCRLKLFNEDVISMAPNSHLEMDEAVFNRGKREKRSFLSMLKGKCMFYSLRLFSFRKASMKIRTPTAILGVRGTKFGVDVYWVEEDKRSEIGILIAHRGDEMGMYLARAEPVGGGKSYTDCFSEDGYLDVNGKTLAPGEMYKGETGAVIPTPPEYVKAFESETEVKKVEGKVSGEKAEEEEKEKKAEEEEAEEEAEEGAGGEEKPEGEEEKESEESTEGVAVGIDTEGEAYPAAVTEFTENLADTTQQEIAEDIESGFLEGKTSCGVSGIAAIITMSHAFDQAWSDTGKGPIYISDTPNVLMGGAETHIAHERAHENDDAFKMLAEEQDAAATKVHVNYFDWGFGSDISIDPKHDFNYFNGGRYLDESGHEYLEWGWWQDISGSEIGKIGDHSGNDFYAAAASIWHIEGVRTHPDYISYLQQQNFSATYSGEAKGVFADSSAADVQFLTGSFYCHINFGTANVSNFEINAHKAGDPASNAVHLYNGSGTLEQDGNFDITSFDGTINGQPLAGQPFTGATGICAGGKAQGVGGLWWAHGGNHYWATGEFHGKR